MKKVLELLDLRYERSCLEKVEECVQDWIEFKEDQYEEEEELLLAMEEINKRKEELKITEMEWFSVWMLGRVKK